MNLALVPVLLKALEHDLLLGDALDKLERPRTHRPVGDIPTCFSERLRRQHHTRTVGEHTQERRIHPRQFEPNRQRIDHDDVGD